jgi:signal peptidase I
MMPSLGQFFAGWRKAAGTLYVFSVFLYGILWAGMYKHFYGLLMWLAALLIYCVVNIASAYHIGKRTKQRNFKAYKRLTIYVIAAAVHLALSLLILLQLGLPIKLYHIPTSSMAPALRVGDYFAIDRHVDSEDIRRGDIVVFTSPTHAKITYVKRVVGLPGEVVEIYGQKVWINGQRLAEPYLPKAPPPQPYFGRRHHGPLSVPPDSIYVLGDNRAHSADSRQFKSIKLSSVLGKTLYVLWSADLNRIGKRSF